MTEIRNIYGTVIATGEGTIAEVSATNRADLRGADLRGADLRGANLGEADLGRANLIEADLRGADLSRAYLRWASLSGADLRGANLGDANLIEADLRGADLSRAYLRWASLSDANLSLADLSRADLIEADLRWANLGEADLGLADLGYIPAPLVLLAQWGALPDALTLDLMRYDAANHPEPERFLAWADGGPCPYSGLSVARVANFQERRGLIKADFLSLPVKSAWHLVCELAEVKGFRFAPEEVK